MDPKMKENPLCPVCGFKLDHPAWDPVNGPSDEICPSCGIQFGYSDAAGGDPARRQEVYRDWRRKWIEGGMKWDSAAVEDPPADWDPVKQLQRLQDQS